VGRPPLLAGKDKWINGKSELRELLEMKEA